jgi:hypothetical protein
MSFQKRQKRTIALLLVAVMYWTMVKKMETDSIAQNLNIPASDRLSSCVLRNLNYDDEFLYTVKSGTKEKIYVDPSDSNVISNMDQLRWIFMPVIANGQHVSNTFHIINSVNDMVLCASSRHLDFMKHRRQVELIKLGDLDENGLAFNRECMWMLGSARNKIKKDVFDPEENSKFTIWNFEYKEPLYAASFTLRSEIRSKRNVYTWYSKPNSLQFVWFIYCS